MLLKTVKVSSKGQITLPVEALRALKAKKGTEFVIIQEGDHLVLVKAESVGKRLLDEFGGWSHLSAPAFQELWDNPEDAIWDAA